MRAQRIFWFIFAIAAGAAGGLLLGWFVIPGGPTTGTTPESLRADYRTDLVLMTAEIYKQDGDPAAAANQLIEFNSGLSPLRTVQQAILSGQELGYASADIELMARLYQGLQGWTPPTETSQP